jgi:hypothetical protein
METLQTLSPKRIPVRTLSPLDFRRYYIDRVLFEMVKVSRGREIALLNVKGAIRHIKAHTIRFLKDNFDAYHFFDSPRNIYYSLAHLENMPMFSFVPVLRQIQQQQFGTDFMKYFKGIDLGMDFDEDCLYCKQGSQCSKHEKTVNPQICSKCEDYHTNWDTVYQETARTKELFDNWSIPYQLKTSGSGFHINIEWKYWCGCKDAIERINRLRGLAAEDYAALSKWFLVELSAINNLTSLDTSVADIRRIWKMPYSIDIKTGHVALPLTDEQFKNFNWDIVAPDKVVDTVRDRGLIERPGSTEDLKGFLNNFLLG